MVAGIFYSDAKIKNIALKRLFSIVIPVKRRFLAKNT